MNVAARGRFHDFFPFQSPVKAANLTFISYDTYLSLFQFLDFIIKVAVNARIVAAACWVECHHRDVLKPYLNRDTAT